MSAPASRRGFLRGLSTLPLIGGGVASISAQSASDAEARFVALAPKLVPLLDEYDRLWAPTRTVYEAAMCAVACRPWARMETSPGWAAYIEARRPADEMAEYIDTLVEPYFDLALESFDAILLRHRYGMSFEAWHNKVMDDLDRLWRRS